MYYTLQHFATTYNFKKKIFKKKTKKLYIYKNKNLLRDIVNKKKKGKK